MSIEINHSRPFFQRHNGPEDNEIEEMLQHVGAESVNQLIEQTIPSHIRLDHSLNLPEAQSEHEFLAAFSSLMKKNKVFKSYIGLGYYNCYLPPVIQRNILENPGWYTAYTPYQAEIAPGEVGSTG